MRYFIILISFIFTTGALQAQNVISINASAEVAIPADRIAFNINLNAEGETPQKAYDLHKEREKVLVELLKKHDIREKNIDFEPISISRINNEYNRDGDKFVRTRQTVILTLDDFNLYEEIQLILIENDFNEFSGNFMSSETEQGEEKALKKAINLARDKAEIIAKESGLHISGIKDISYSYNQDPRPMMEMRMSSDSGSLMEYDQSVSFSANVSVTYNFEQ